MNNKKKNVTVQKIETNKAEESAKYLSSWQFCQNKQWILTIFPWSLHCFIHVQCFNFKQVYYFCNLSSALYLLPFRNISLINTNNVQANTTQCYPLVYIHKF